jgi:eukaryotic-like serine/threonine-protein kinase
VLSDRYELGEQLGAGGMGRVVAAHDHVLDREVAVKLLGPTPDPVARERFLREARAAARLRHPNAVLVHDAGEHDGQPYLVMELVHGRTLADLVASEGPLPFEDAIAITTGILDVLAVAHRQGLVHRDVKPANVLLPDDGGVKLADFGIAKALDDAATGLTTSGTVIGTASYLAPELVEGRAASPASDVYAVGCLLYALLAGDPPFTGEHAVAVAYAHRHTPVPDLRSRRPDLPDDLRAVVERSLAKDPAQRYPDAAAMQLALLEGPTRVPSAPSVPAPAVPLAPVGDGTAVLPPATAPVEGAGPVVQGGRRTWTSGVLVGVLVAALLLGGIGWWSTTRDGDLPAESAGPTGETQPDAADDPGPAEPAEPDEAEVEEVEGDGTAPDVDSVEDLIGVLSSAPAGTYGEKHDDLLEDLVDLTREEGSKRAEEAEAVRIDVVDWVEDGELDPEVGRQAIAVLEREAGGG